jgi:hypothetical protein
MKLLWCGGSEQSGRMIMTLLMDLGLTWGVVTAGFVGLLFYRRALAQYVDNHTKNGMSLPSKTALRMKIQSLMFPIHATGLLSFFMYMLTVGYWLISLGLSTA